MNIVVKNADELSRLIAEEIIKVVKENKNPVLGLATGSSPLGIYANLIKAYENGEVSFKKVKTFNLDEYVKTYEEQTYRYFMNENLFNHVDIDKKNTNFPSLDNYSHYDEMIKDNGGIDIQLLGIGGNGHIAFNEPNTSFDSLTHVTDLTEKTRSDNARFFKDISEVPTQAITMGLKSIMNAKKVVLIATGKNKADAIKKLIEDEPNESLPCSILKKHPNCTIYVDEDAYSLVK